MKDAGAVVSALVLAAYAAALPTPAHAYLDPGTGSMMLQLLLGGVAGIAIAGKLYWHKLLTAFGLRKPAPSEAEAAPVERRH